VAPAVRAVQLDRVFGDIVWTTCITAAALATVTRVEPAWVAAVRATVALYLGEEP
jgi:hypothetical protein